MVRRRTLHCRRYHVLVQRYRAQRGNHAAEAKSWLTVADEFVKLEKLDDYTIKFTFAAPYGLFLQRLATPDGSDMVEFPEHYVKQFHAS